MWRREWLVASVLAAAAATALDSALVQRKSSLFTGGFLSVDHLKGPGEILAYLAGAFVSDLGVTAVLAAIGLALASWLRLGQAARRLLCGAVAFGPLLVSDVVSYRIFEYLGGAFDLGLMFDLVGRRPGEIWAVAGTFLVPLAVTAAVGLAVAALVVWIVQRRYPGGALGPDERRPGWRTSIVLPACVALLGLGTNTALRLERESLDNGLRRKPSGRAFGAIVGLVSDVDRDGYGLLVRPDDPSPLDARVYPYAVDWPGNGLDENGVGGDLPAGSQPYLEDRTSAPQWAQRPDVILFLLETFRADAVGAQVEGRPVTPVLDDLGRRGVSLAHAYSPNGYTVQSRFHVFSGSVANLRGETSLIDDFHANGYETAYFSGQDESFGDGLLPVGFERAGLFYDARQDRAKRYTDFATPGSLAVPSSLVQERIREFLGRRSREKPLFLYVNFHDAHFPYHHAGVQPLVSSTVLARGEIGPARVEELRRMYLNTAANVDRAIGEVVADVARATGREPAVIVTADHGESLFDEGFLGHGYALNDAQTRVPLVVANLPMVIREPWSQADLRDGVREALSRAESGQPTVVADTGREVFQYLGTVERPAQIGFTSNAGRTIYDFREDRVRLADGRWERPSDLAGEPRDRFLALVRLWERMILARAGEPAKAP